MNWTGVYMQHQQPGAVYGGLWDVVHQMSSLYNDNEAYPKELRAPDGTVVLNGDDLRSLCYDWLSWPLDVQHGHLQLIHQRHEELHAQTGA